MTRSRLELLQWFGLLGGALAWTAQHVLGYGISDSGCRIAGQQWDLHVGVMQTVLSLLMGTVVVAAFVSSYVVFRATSAVEEDAPGPPGRIHFFAQAALLGNVLFFVMVVLDGVSSVYHLPCRQA